MDVAVRIIEALDFVFQPDLECPARGFVGEIIGSIEQLDDDTAAVGEAFAAKRKAAFGDGRGQMDFYAAAKVRQAFTGAIELSLVHEIAAIVIWHLAAQTRRFGRW